MEKPYRIEDEKDLVDTRYRRQYRIRISKRKKRRRYLSELKALLIFRTKLENQ